MSPLAQRGRKALGHETRVGHRLSLLRAAALQHRGRIVQATSLGVEGMVITDRIARHQLQVVVADGCDTCYPLADWSIDDVWHHIEVHHVPYADLHDQGYPSIGCHPCTRAVAPEEDVRAGRWWWEQGDARECGLHSRPQTVTA